MFMFCNSTFTDSIPLDIISEPRSPKISRRALAFLNAAPHQSIAAVATAPCSAKHRRGCNIVFIGFSISLPLMIYEANSVREVHLSGRQCRQRAAPRDLHIRGESHLWTH